MNRLSKFRKMLKHGVNKDRIYSIRRAESLSDSINVFLSYRTVDLNNELVLDVGCEYGMAWSIFIGKGFRYVGLDFIPEHLKICELLSIPVISFDLEKDDFSKLPEVDYIFCRHVVEHLLEPKGVISKLISRLKIGGLIYVQSAIFKKEEHTIHIHPFRNVEDFQKTFDLEVLETLVLDTTLSLNIKHVQNGVVYIGRKIAMQERVLKFKEEMRDIEENSVMGTKNRIPSVAKRQKSYLLWNSKTPISLSNKSLGIISIPECRSIMSSVHYFFEFLRLYKERDDEVVLDVGCGCGLAYPHIQWIGFNYFGVDFIPDYLELCRINHIPSKYFDLESSDYYKLGLYDHAFCRRILEHLQKPKWVLFRVMENIMPGGLIYIQSFWEDENTFNSIINSMRAEILYKGDGVSAQLEGGDKDKVVILRKC